MIDNIDDRRENLSTEENVRAIPQRSTDIISYLLAAKDPESGGSLSNEEVRSESFLMLGAGKPKSDPMYEIH